ncbi:MAG TPA: S26 family signal peptidase, partial [Nannocystis sp.]
FQVPHCELYEETLDGHTYVVRYKTNLDPRAGARRSGEWTVPEGHLLVMGDNRNESHDSLAWTREGEAVVADGLVSSKDLRDLTDEKLFFPSHPDDASVRGDTNFDHVLYIAEHASDIHGLKLEVWREPVLGGEAVWRALTAAQGEGARELAFPELVDSDERLGSKANARLRARLLREGGPVEKLSIAGDDVAQDIVIRLDAADAVMRLRCGNAVCRTPGRIAEKVAEIVERWSRDHSQDARQLLDGDGAARYTPHLVSRAATADVFVERSYTVARGKTDPPSPAGVVRLRAWRQPTEGIAVVRDAALFAAGGPRETARQVMDDGSGVLTGDDAWLLEDEERFIYVRTDPKNMIVFSLECGRQRCPKDTQVLALAREVEARVPAVAQDRSRLPELLAPGDLPNARELPPAVRPDRYEYDKIRLDASVRDVAYSLAVWAWRRPPEGLDDKFEALKAKIPNARPDDSVASGAVVGDAESGRGTQYIFAVPATELVVRIQCSAGLCPDPSIARDIARRAYQKAQDPANFIDPAAQRPQPYVPRGNVKGRAERIWLPPNRFWLPIR